MKPEVASNALAPLGQGKHVVQLSGPVSRKRLMLRAACRMRCSFSTSAIRTKPSPCSPKPMPGETATSAFSTSSVENSTLPRPGKLPGMGVHANIEARGGGMSQPARPKDFHQHIAPALIGFAHLADTVVGPVERGRRRDLDRRESAIIEVGFDPAERGNDALIPHRKADPPAGHGIGLGHRCELDRDVHCARHLQHRRRRSPVEIDFRISEIREQKHAVLLGERDQVFVEVEIGHIRCRIRGIADDHRDGFWDGVHDGALKAAKNAGVGSEWTERITPPAMRNPNAWIG